MSLNEAELKLAGSVAAAGRQVNKMERASEQSSVGKRWPQLFRTGQESKMSLRAEKAWATAAGAAGCNLPLGNFNSMPLKLSAYEAAGPVARY